MNSVISECLVRAKDLKDLDISFAELGINGFSEANQIKNKICEYVIDVLRSIPEADHDDVLVIEAANLAKAATNGVNEWCEKTKVIAQSGVHTPDFPQSKQAINQQLQKIYIGIRKSLATVELKYRSGGGSGSDVSALKDDLESLQARMRSSMAETEAALKQAQSVVETFKDAYVEKGLQKSSEQFTEILSNHVKHERNWLLLVLLFAFCLTLAIGYTVAHQPPLSSSTAIGIYFFKRLSVVSVIAVFLSVALSKYSAERHLRIVYSHRQKVVDLFNFFEGAIGNDEAKNDLRIEVAKFIFSDPSSGYAPGSGKSSELNIGSFVSAADKMVRHK